VALDFISKKLLDGAGRNGPIALMYHSISPGKSKPNWRWAISFSNFKSHLDIIESFGWNIVDIEAYAHLNDLPDKTIAITFDDGYADNYYAFEELAKRKMKASWFIVSNDIGNSAGWQESGGEQKKLMLSKHQILEMNSAGMRIGSHCCRHQKLTMLSRQQLRYELIFSKLMLSTLLNTEVNSFAYPYGIYNESIVNAVKQAGYKVACSTNSGFGLVENNPLLIRRVAIVATDSASKFSRKLAFADNDVSDIKLYCYYLNQLKQKCFVK
jgi:peptidoglycan/xylan/chitin deacetylase (PgdA/CDA1 family)